MTPTRRDVAVDILQGLLIAGAVVLIVLFGASDGHVFIYRGF